jgi:transcriptional regulator with XRE-family HTH domain
MTKKSGHNRSHSLREEFNEFEDPGEPGISDEFGEAVEAGELDEFDPLDGLKIPDDDDNMGWLELQPENLQAGILLRFLRRRLELSQGKLAKFLKITDETLNTWEKGITPINPTRLGGLVRYLKIKNQEAERFVLLVKPDLLDNVKATWLQRQISARNWKQISYPALDPEWLSAQPEDMQGRLLLRALRQRKGLRQDELSVKIGLYSTSVVRWETGQTPIKLSKLGTLIKVLTLPDEDAERLVMLVRPDIVEKTGPEWLRRKISGKDRYCINFPALDPVWLNAQPEHLRIGLFLHDLIEKAEITREAMTQEIEVSRNTIVLWEDGTNPIDVTKLGGIIRKLKSLEDEKKRISDDDAERLVLLARPDINPASNPQWLRGQIAAGNWEHISFPALNKEWRDAQPENAQLSLFVRALRERAGLTQEELPETLNLGYKFVRGWEHGRPIYPYRLGHFLDIVNASESEAEDFILLAQPNNVLDADIEWLRRKIADEYGWFYISFPAFDDEWLSARPEHLHGRLLVQSVREFLGLTQEEFASRMGVSKRTVARWELDQRKISPDAVKLALSFLEPGALPAPPPPEQSPQ